MHSHSPRLHHSLSLPWAASFALTLITNLFEEPEVYDDACSLLSEVLITDQGVRGQVNDWVEDALILGGTCRVLGGYL